MNDVQISLDPPVSDNPPQNDAKTKRDDETTQLKQMESRVFRFAVVLVILSMILYFINATCKQIVDLISAQNETSLTISQSLDYYTYFIILKDPQNSLLPPPPEFHHALIEFSRKNAALIYTVDRISPFTWLTKLSKQVAKLKPTDGGTSFLKGYTVNPETHSLKDLLDDGVYQIRLYQAIRDSAQNKSIKWHGIVDVMTIYMLPVLYAVLGACLFTFRSWCRERRHGRPNLHWPDHTSRILVAGIAGIAIGSLSDFFVKEMILPPLALSFLVGYSIETFTSRLDTIMRNLKRDGRGLAPNSHHAG
jgi:hypothetical protein